MRRVVKTLFGLAALLGVLADPSGARGDGKSPDLVDPPAFEAFLVIPLRVHVLSSGDLPELNCKLRDDDVTRIFGKVNRIWNKAGIHWGLDSIVREPAARQEKFRLARDLDGPRNLGLYRLLIPEASHAFDGLHVYYIHRFVVNGVWLGDDAALVQETARLREVEGGIDEPVPRVTAHELGHGLGLPHRQDRTNLLASGTTGTLLNADEAETVRDTARRLKGVRTVPALKVAAAEAESSGDLARARKAWTWLSEIPGAGDEPRKAVERLKAAPERPRTGAASRSTADRDR
jgi:hypothetical protein